MIKINWSGRSHNYTDIEIKNFIKIIKSADPLTQGPHLKKFEKDLSKYLNKKNISVVSSAAAALDIIAILLNIKKGDEIIIPAHTYCASAIPFARNGAKIIWCDIDLRTQVIDLEDLKKKITNKTKAIVAVHLYGYACDINSIKKIVKKKNIKIVEDCAQAFGAKLGSDYAGTIGDYGCFSFHAQKNITTLGEGGALYVKNLNKFNQVKGLRHNGHRNYSFKRKNYWLPAMGNLDEDNKKSWPYKFTLSEIQCAAGWMMLKRVNKLNQKRINRAQKLIKKLSSYSELKFHISKEKKRHVYHLIPAYCNKTKYFNRDKLIRILYEKFNIKSIVQYYPLYKYPLFRKKGFKVANCPNTENFFNNMISFPFHISMKDKDFDYMISSVKKSLEILRKDI